MQAVSKISKPGWAGIILAGSMLLSIFGNFRISLAGTLVHPYLLLLFPLMFMANINPFRLQRSILIPLGIYGVFMSASMIVHEFNYSEVLKIFAGIFSFLFFTQTVRTEKDLTYVSYALILLSVVLSFRIIFFSQSDDVSLLAGVNVLSEEGLGNKNAQSLYMLPGIFFAFFHLKRSIDQRKNMMSLLWVASMVPLVLGTGLSGNRSGYLGFIIIALIFLVNLKMNIQSIVLIFVGIVASYFMLEQFASKLISHKYEQTTGNYGSDDQREKLLINSFAVGLENPVLGVGFRRLARELAIRTKTGNQYTDPHNLYGYLFGGGGVFSFFGFMFFLYNVFRRALKHRSIKRKIRFNFRDHDIAIWLIGLLFLFAVRSLFTREILYSPTFQAALGITVSALFFYWNQLVGIILNSRKQRPTYQTKANAR